MSMTSYERYMAVCQLREPDRVPVSPFIMTFAAKLAGVPYIDYCRIGEVMAEAQLTCIRRFGYDAVALGSDAVREAETVGAPIYWQKDEVPSTTGEPLIKSRGDLTKLRLPDPLGKNRMHEQIKALKILLRELGDDEIVYAWVEAPFQVSALLRNINYFMMDIVGDPQLVHDLMRFSLQLELSFGLAQIEAGARFIGIGDSIASLVSPDHYREFNLPYITELIAGLKASGALVKYHACGNTRALLPLFLKLDADIINLDSLVDLREAKLILGNNVCIKGNLNPTGIMLKGTPETVRKAARKCIREGGLHGGFILSPGCEVPRDTPAENLEALIAVGKTDGVYPINIDDFEDA